MNQIITKSKALLATILAYLPSKIPTGMTEFNAWLDSIVKLVGPIADDRSLKWVISNEVMRLPSGKDSVPKMLFVKVLRKFAANQLAAATVNNLKAEQDAEIKKASENKQNETEPKEIKENMV